MIADIGGTLVIAMTIGVAILFVRALMYAPKGDHQ